MSRVVPEPITMGTRTKASEHERVTWTSGCTKVGWGSIRMIVPDVELDCGNGVIVRYTDIGPRRAEPVFLFHGWIANIVEAWLVNGLLGELLNAGYRVIAWEARGCGRSSKPYDPAMYGKSVIDDWVRILDAVGVQKIHNIGYSMGAELAICAAAKHPDRVLSVCVGGSGWAGGDFGIEHRVHMERVGDLCLWQDGATFGAPCSKIPNPIGIARLCWYPCCVSWLIANVMCEDGIPRDLRAGSILFKQHSLQNVQGVSEGELRALEVPFSGLMGELDPERKYLERLLDIVPGFQMTIIPGADHMQAGDSVEYRHFVLGHLRAAIGGGPGEQSAVA